MSYADRAIRLLQQSSPDAQGNAGAALVIGRALVWALLAIAAAIEGK